MSLSLSELTELIGYADSAHYRTNERQFEPESVHYFRSAKDRQGENFSVNGFYVFDTSGKADSPLSSHPVVCVAEAPSVADAQRLHRRIWNLGNVPFLIVRLPDQVRVYSGFRFESSNEAGLILKEGFASKGKLKSALASFTAASIDSMRIWDLQRQHLDTRHRVDTTLLQNLNQLAKALSKNCSPMLQPELAHALIGKFVYLRYLRDRDILSDKWLAKHGIDLTKIFGPAASVGKLKRLDDALEVRFNGDIFYIDYGLGCPLNDAHIQLVASVFSGDQIQAGETGIVRQLHLQFKAYDFRNIPVEMLSSIYEQFMRMQQRARTHGAYYTPEVLADYLLSEINSVRKIKPGMTFLDPSAGSGIFLVLAYRRLIELELAAKGLAPSKIGPKRLREILLESIYGVERQRDACNVAIFSLILTLLHYVDPPALHANEGFKFPQLLNKRIFQGDFFNRDLNLPTPKDGFDVVVGNPPWIEIKPDSEGEDAARDWITSEKTIAGNRVADAFTVKGGRLLKTEGVAGILLPATTLFTLEGRRFRQTLFTEFSVSRITNFANLRQNIFGGRATLPAATLVFRKADEQRRTQPIIHYGPFAVDQIAGASNELWVLTVHGTEIKYVPQSEAATGDASVWKFALWGTSRDKRAIDRLRALYPLTLSRFCEKKGWGKQMPREGAQLRNPKDEEEKAKEGGKKSPPDRLIYREELKGRNRFVTDEFNRIVRGGLAFSLPDQSLVRIPDDLCYVRERGGMSGLEVNKPPHIMISAAWKNFLIYSDDYFAIPPRQIGLTAPKKDSEQLRALTVYLASSLVDYFLFFQVPAWGVYKDFPLVVLSSVRSIPTPDFSPNQVSLLADVHRQISSSQNGTFRLVSDNTSTAAAKNQRFIDQTVFSALALPDDLKLLIEDFRDTRLQLDKGHSALASLNRRPSNKALEAYGRTLQDELQRFLLGEGNITVTIINSTDLIQCIVKIYKQSEKNLKMITVLDASEQSKKLRALRSLRERLREKFSQWTYIDRMLLLFSGNGVQLFKNPRVLDWTRTQALNDADSIIAEILSSGTFSS